MKLVTLSQQSSSLKSTISGTNSSDDAIPLSISKDSIAGNLKDQKNVALVVSTTGKGALKALDKDNLLRSDNLDISLNDPKTGKKMEMSSLNGSCPVLFTLKGEMDDPKQVAQCVYLDTTKNTYSSEGCTATNKTRIGQTNFYLTTCCCTHLTKFAVSLKPETKIDEPVQEPGSDDDDDNLPLILGLSLGLGIPALIGIIVILYCYIKKRAA